MKVYVTKYALTRGIQFVEVKDVGDGIMKEETYNSYLYKEGRDWHKTLPSATKKAKIMRDKKIVSLKRQMIKLENMNFDEAV